MPCIMRTTSCAWFLGEGAGVNSIEVKTHFGNEMHEDGETEKKKKSRILSTVRDGNTALQKTCYMMPPTIVHTPNGSWVSPAL